MSDVYTEGQTYAILEAIGVTVVNDTSTHWMCLCPFHANMDTPAMVVDKEQGMFLCMNASCDRRGKIEDMITSLTKKTFFQTQVLIMRAKENSKLDLEKFVKKQLAPEEFPKYPTERVEKEHEAFWKNKDAVKYMMEQRHFERKTLDEFRVGFVYDKKSKSHLVTVPMFDADGNGVGFIGRGIYDKTFKNSLKLPRRHTLFNIHNAKKTPATIVTEASFDAMRAWQATGTHAVAVLGSFLGDGQRRQMEKYFTSLVIATDDDKSKNYKGHCNRCRRRGEQECIGHNAGYELGLEIVDNVDGVRKTWAHLNSLKRYDGHKDFGDLTDEQVKYAVEHALTNFEMMRRA